MAFHFTFEKDWRSAPVAFWVHVPVADTPRFEPAAPEIVLHKGYPVLHVTFGEYDLHFSSGVQLAHCIEVLATKPLPTSRQLSARRGPAFGPNGHWLSRLPSALKSPRARFKLVETLRAARQFSETNAPGQAFEKKNRQDDGLQDHAARAGKYRKFFVKPGGRYATLFSIEEKIWA